MDFKTLFLILFATLIISLMSFVAAWFLRHKVTKYLHYLITFAAGVLLASAFLDLMPEGLHDVDLHLGLLFVLIGIILFFLIERFIHWHHCGKHDCHRESLGKLNLIGDSIHNFLDGIIIAGSFLINPLTGIFTSIAIVAHELPQEIGDYSILIHSGYTHKNALKMNVLVSLTALIGGLFGFFLLSSFETFLPFLVLLTAGGFIYIALSDIFPDLHQHKEERKIILEGIILILTLIVFWFLFSLLGHSH